MPLLVDQLVEVIPLIHHRNVPRSVQQARDRASRKRHNITRGPARERVVRGVTVVCLIGNVAVDCHEPEYCTAIIAVRVLDERSLAKF